MQNIRILLGQRVRELRKGMGWSQEELGERANLHPTYVGGIERGERNVSLDNLNKLAAAFGLSLGELFQLPSSDGSERHSVQTSITTLLRRQDDRSLEFILKFLKVFEEFAEGEKDPRKQKH